MTDILAVGDVAANRADLASMFRHVRAELTASPCVFGQLETVISDRGAAVPNAKLAMRAPPALAPVLRDSGFTLMSSAGNHCLDWGYDALQDTLDHADAAGLIVAGAGANLAEAVRPVFLQVGGLRVALIAANSILPEGYAASASRPGCAPLRAHTQYEMIEHDQPGTPPRVLSFCERPDLERLLAAIRSARAEADVVLFSVHWGIHMVRGSLADYQREAGHAAIQAGADAVIGHHPHLMKGVEFHRGKPIFYSLGNFAIEQPHAFDPAIVHTESFRHLVSLNPSWTLDGTYMLPRDTRITAIVRLVAGPGGVTAVRLRPCWVEDDSAPRPLVHDEPLFDEVLAYLREVTASEGLNTIFAVDGDELVLRARS